MTHLEFVVLGVPISNQGNDANVQAWRAQVAVEAQRQWRKKAILTSELKGVIINFHATEKPTLDVDNMSKPIFDAMQGIVYVDDRQITQAEITHVRINAAFCFVGASKLIVPAVRKGNHFVYIRIEDPVVPFPLPK